MTAVYFIVERVNGREMPALLHDPKPEQLRGHVYCLRLDTLPDADRWLGKNLTELAETYAFLRDRNRLPT